MVTVGALLEFTSTKPEIPAPAPKLEQPLSGISSSYCKTKGRATRPNAANPENPKPTETRWQVLAKLLKRPFLKQHALLYVSQAIVSAQAQASTLQSAASKEIQS